MNLFYFGTSQRRLFGIYEPALPGSPGRRAAVLCHPWGSEYLHAYRAVRQLAIRLSAIGVHTLRFDFFGTGDSAGDMIDADVRGWETDIESAMEELRDTVGVTKVALIGLRLGATLAATVAARRPEEVDALVLWDPVVSGEEYVESLLANRLESTLGEPGQVREIQGFTLTTDMERDFRVAELVTLIPALPMRTLIIVTERLRSHETLRTALHGRAAARPLAIEHIGSVQPWLDESTNTGALPVSVVRRIVEWMK